MKKKACKECNMIVDANIEECPNCKSKSFAATFQGRLSILDPKTSHIAQKLNIEKQGEYAIKTRG